MYAKDIKETKLECPLCSTLVCFECKEEWHEGISCDEAFVNKLPFSSYQDRISFCPVCKLKLQKLDNTCNHITCQVCGYEWCWICKQNFAVPHCGGFADFAGGAVIRVQPPSTSPPGLIVSLKLREHKWEYLLAIVLFFFFICAIPMILVATAVCFQTVAICLSLYEHFEYSDHSKLWLLLAIPYIVLGGCFTFVFNMYIIVLAILASPVGVAFIAYELLDEFRYLRGEWQRQVDAYREQDLADQQLAAKNFQDAQNRLN